MTRKSTKEIFVKKAKEIHFNRYDYSKVDYVNNRVKVMIVCFEHGLFEQSPDNHLRNKGCPDCGNIRKRISRRKDLKWFVKIASEIHNSKYSYSKSDYVASAIKVTITCHKHGDFRQTPNNHLRGKGCVKCGGSSLKSLEEFTAQANNIHKNKYDYSKANYKGAHEKIIIICAKHGKFSQMPGSHIYQAQGCPKCTNWVSKLEAKWLNCLKIPFKNRQKKVIVNDKIFTVDGFDPQTNTIYEFYGDYWHGNPNVYNARNINPTRKCTFGELYKKTIEKEDILKNAGFDLVTIWENDWKKLDANRKIIAK